MNELSTQSTSSKQVSVFSNIDTFRQTQEMAGFLAASSIVPSTYQKNVPNCVIALEMAFRLQADPLMIMQNLYIVHGKPAFSSQFLIASINSCGRFTALQYEFTGETGQDGWSCRAYAKELATGETVYGPSVSIAMAKAEGWYSKNGSKWQTMPELMLTYRAATFFVRTKAPEISMGMHTVEEEKDMGVAEIVSEGSATSSVVESIVSISPAAEKKPARKKASKKKQEPEQEDNFKAEIEAIKKTIDDCDTTADLSTEGKEIGEALAGVPEELQAELRNYYAEKMKALKAYEESQNQQSNSAS